jgi:hypothetical protein
MPTAPLRVLFLLSIAFFALFMALSLSSLRTSSEVSEGLGDDSSSSFPEKLPSCLSSIFAAKTAFRVISLQKVSADSSSS